jgi:tetrapyrrole methylase family protein / MazG family protein
MPAGLTVVGLGPGDSRHWTRAADKLLRQAPEIYLRTTHPVDMADSPAQRHSFDDLYRSAASPDEAHRQIAANLIRLGQRAEGVIYATPGHPAVDDPVLPYLRPLAQAAGLPLTLIPGLSLLEANVSALALDTSAGWQIVPAATVARLHHPPLASDRPALITGLMSQELAGQVQQTLLNAYAPNFNVTLIQAAGTPREQTWNGPLVELAHPRPFDPLTTLYLPADPANASLTTFQETIAHLRAPEGCPWDKVQTHQSLRPYLLEETYEVLEALDAGNPAALAEELGDLLLQIGLHTQIATGAGEFRMGQVIGQIQRKLLRRHPHVFGDVTVNGAEEVTINWEAIKKAERAAQNGPTETPPSVLDGVPKDLPALAQALTLSKRAVRVGFEWPNLEGVLDKLVEEAHEIVTANNPAELEAEFGDLLFTAVNLARWRQVDPESALRATNARFTRRFKQIEALAAAQGKHLPEMTLAEMDALWGEAKKNE